ncbi:MAG: TetR/AcrR family transcriptional regulator [Pirellulales bacterium]|nr:TetR/AcrR family transcriptional regulator [Pirellulales bacterium]
MTSDVSSCGNHDAAKHDEILKQAILIFAADGFARSDVQTIANAAGVGKGTVYRYFGNKLDLFYACTGTVGERLTERLVKATEQEQSPIKKVRAACIAYVQFFWDTPEYLELLVQERAEFRSVKPDSHYQFENSVIDELSDILKAAVDVGEIRPVEIRKTLIVMSNVLFGSLVHAISHALPEGSKDTPVTLAAYAIDLILRGLRVETPSGIEDESGELRS